MIVLYGANLSPFVRKLKIFFEAKGLEYRQESVCPTSITLGGLDKLSVLKEIPAIIDDDYNLADDTAICGYYEKRFTQPALYPTDPQDYGKCLWFEKYAAAVLADVLVKKIFFQKLIMPATFKQSTDQIILQQGLTQAQEIFNYLESKLGKYKYIVNSRFTVADIAIFSCFLSYIHADYTVNSSTWPKLAYYIQTVMRHSSVQRILAAEDAEIKQLQAISIAI